MRCQVNQTKTCLSLFQLTENNDLGKTMILVDHLMGPLTRHSVFLVTKNLVRKIIHGDGHTFSWEFMNTPVTPGIPRLRVRINPNHFKYNYILCHDLAPKRLV